MGAYGLFRSTCIPGLAKLGLVAVVVSCGNATSTPNTGGGGPGLNSSGSGSGGSLGSSSGNQSGGGSGGSSGSSGSSGGGTSSGGSGSSGGAVNPSGGDGGMTFLVEGGADASVGGACQSADFGKACSSFTTPTGTTIQLGPYGAVLDVNVGKGFENTVPSSDTSPQPSSTCQTFA